MDKSRLLGEHGFTAEVSMRGVAEVCLDEAQLPARGGVECLWPREEGRQLSQRGRDKPDDINDLTTL